MLAWHWNPCLAVEKDGIDHEHRKEMERNRREKEARKRREENMKKDIRMKLLKGLKKI